ncbi:hypothetical protein [Parasitella parasitica]|uniref:C2H2-type domain-containing protein n=1 Tax=Parasitella parasitica TaxID=35722 RepID=A0A0B7NTI2_9FUNG|nr:hypothetical protein [Parasitella parasitica]
MTQSEDSSYFSLNNPTIYNKPQPTTTSVSASQVIPQAKSGLLNRRRQQHPQAYLQPLELPSLPPLSQLLPNKTTKKDSTTHESASTTAADTAAAAAAAAVAAGIIPELAYAGQPKNNGLFNDFNTTHTTTYPATTAPPVATTNMAQLMDPVAAAAAAAAAVATNEFSTNLPLDGIYSMQPTVASMNQTSTAAPSSMYLSNYGPHLMQTHPQPSLMMQPQHPPAQQQRQQQQQKQQQHQRTRQLSSSSSSSADKQYSFVAIPGTNQKKRPRRRYDEVERLYHCTWPGCSKAYGTLNHLNAHVSMQKHGPKRHPAEFKEMRKIWRKQKKEREAQKKRNEEAMEQHMMSQGPPPPPLPRAHPQVPFSFNNLPVSGFY